MCTDNQAVETYQLLVESLVKAIRQIQTSINQFDEVIEEKRLLADHDQSKRIQSKVLPHVCRILSRKWPKFVSP